MAYLEVHFGLLFSCFPPAREAEKKNVRRQSEAFLLASRAATLSRWKQPVTVQSETRFLLPSRTSPAVDKRRNTPFLFLRSLKTFCNFHQAFY